MGLKRNFSYPHFESNFVQKRDVPTALMPIQKHAKVPVQSRWPELRQVRRRKRHSCVWRWAPAHTKLPATANSTWLLCHYTVTTKIKEADCERFQTGFCVRRCHLESFCNKIKRTRTPTLSERMSYFQEENL